jgi:hypothetical protein
VPFAEMGATQPESHVFWNPGTMLFEVTVFRRNGPDLIIKHLPLHTANQLREAIINTLHERYTLLLPAIHHSAYGLSRSPYSLQFQRSRVPARSLGRAKA